LTQVVIEAIRQRLDKGEQSLIYLNRRGYAPLLVCFRCGWRGLCQRCDANFTLHRRSARLRCHYCGADKPAPSACPKCGNEKLYQAGEGTQRVEESLQTYFPQARLLRVDSDTVARKGELERHLNMARDGAADILVGTQILSKGHDFPNVTLVCVLNVDQSLFNVDFRSAEYLFQQVTQVSGRAGRASKPGLVLIQTYYPANPYFEHVRAHDYDGFATAALSERRQANYPPYARFVLLRAESTQADAPLSFLKQIRRYAHEIMQTQNIKHVQVMDPVPSPMERRAGRYRAQLLVRASHRQPLHQLLLDWITRIDNDRIARTVRWSVDVDPTEMY
jgi:primosomal protein N' (replication factor Y)